jgi:glutamate--cysteine ligase
MTGLWAPDDLGPDQCATVRTEHDVRGFVTRTCFKTGPPGRVGIESEWFVHDVADKNDDSHHSDHSDQADRVSLDRLRALVDDASPLPGGSALTFEPGGQLELSTACGDNLPHARDLLDGDLHHLDKLLADRGLLRVGVGLDPVRPPRRIYDSPRYAAMEAFFDLDGPSGRVMMASTASVQVCLDAGADAADVASRWALTNALTPLLIAAFANSPLRLGLPTGFACSRQDVWSRIDPTRTSAPPGADPADAWARYALDARVLLVRRDHEPWVAGPGMTLREWVAGGTPWGRPTYGDLAYHLSTLFPPVRPHGWLELRAIDALPDDLWPVAVAVVAALVEDPQAADTARDALGGLSGHHHRAARNALRDRDLRRAAERCFAAALTALPRVGADSALVAQVDGYADRYIATGRTPADDLLDDWQRSSKEESA